MSFILTDLQFLRLTQAEFLINSMTIIKISFKMCFVFVFNIHHMRKNEISL